MSEPLTALPWQMNQWQQLAGLLEQQRLHHALLLSGPDGIGKVRFSQAFAAYLLCESPAVPFACGTCQACHLQSIGHHPDFKELTPLEGKKQISVDQVRELQHYAGQSAHRQGGRKVVLIHPAEAMNLNAANALLKTLEEPAADTILLLVSHAPSRLLPTIRSRCLQHAMGVPPVEQSRAWLKGYLGDDATTEQLLAESGGRPLAARALFENDGLTTFQQYDQGLGSLLKGKIDCLQLAEKFADDDILTFMDWWQRRLHQLLKSIVLQQGETVHPWSELCHIPARAVFQRLDQALIQLAQLSRGAALNKRLLIEGILLDWRQLCQNRASQ